NLEPATLARLAEIPNIKGIKEEAGINPVQMTDFATVVPDDFALYCGDDTMVLQTLPQGAAGVVSGGSHIIGDLMREMIERYLQGQVRQASDLYFEMMPLFKAFSQGNRLSPIPLLKDAIRLHTGINVGGPRRPSLGATPPEEEELRKVLATLGRLAK